MVVLQWMAKPKVVARPQAGESLIAKSASPYGQNPTGEREHAKDLLVEREVDTILSGPCKAKKFRLAHEKYAQEARYPPRAATHSTFVCSAAGTTLKLSDIVFTKADANWVHHPYEDALVIRAKIGNNLIHRILVDNRNAINILYWHAYQKTGLARADLSPTTSPIYGFTRGHVIPEGTIKLAVTLGGHPRVTTIMTEFLVVNYR